MGDSIWHRPVTKRCKVVCVERRRSELAGSVYRRSLMTS